MWIFLQFDIIGVALKLILLLILNQISNAATRNMMCCAVTGQAAGTAAAVSIVHGQSTMNVDISLVQEELKRQGARIN